MEGGTHCGSQLEVVTHVCHIGKKLIALRMWFAYNYLHRLHTRVLSATPRGYPKTNMISSIEIFWDSAVNRATIVAVENTVVAVHFPPDQWHT